MHMIFEQLSIYFFFMTGEYRIIHLCLVYIDGVKVAWCNAQGIKPPLDMAKALQ